MTDELDVRVGDCRDVLPTLDAGSVHCVVTSPPYWGLRDYGTASWDGGDPECDHLGPPRMSDKTGLSHPELKPREQILAEPSRLVPTPYRDTCGKCGARRIDRQLGLEPTPEEYVANMVAVFREVRRVLRDDGTVWLVLGDSYVSNSAGYDAPPGVNAVVGSTKRGVQNRASPAGLAPKNLVGIPWRVAFALQADGWYLRSDIIWSKPNPMPESVTDRPTKAHEYVFLLSKRATYFFDADAVREPTEEYHVVAPDSWAVGQQSHDVVDFSKRERGRATDILTTEKRSGRNIRSVWNIATQPYPGAHFATFPEALVVPCIKAGTSERGVCSECGAPWERVVEREPGDTEARERPKHLQSERSTLSLSGNGSREWAERGSRRIDAGWRPTCAHDTEPVPATVLDPFAGSGTVGKVAEGLSRRSVLVELNPDYIEQAERRTAQVGLGLRS